MVCDLFLTSEQWNAVRLQIKELENKLSVDIADHYVRAKLQKEHTALSSAVTFVDEITSYNKHIAQLEQEIYESHDQEMTALMREELVLLATSKEHAVRELEDVLYPADLENDKSAFMEIRAGTGGLEASLFAGELARMYTLYGQKRGWSVSIASMAETDIGGYREIVLHVEGKKIYEQLRYEAGVHRVQRVPATETSGRVHTSTVTVVVLPEADEVDFSIDPADLRIDTYRASGAGGQHVNKTDSAIRITHIPTGVVVTCQDERSQHKNRSKALKILQSRLLAAEKEKQSKQIAGMRREMVSSADRSEKVRTYNFPQNRVSDHQVEITVNRLDFFLLGNMDEIILPLVQKGRADRSTSSYFIEFLKIKGSSC